MRAIEIVSEKYKLRILKFSDFRERVYYGSVGTQVELNRLIFSLSGHWLWVMPKNGKINVFGLKLPLTVIESTPKNLSCGQRGTFSKQ